MMACFLAITDHHSLATIKSIVTYQGNMISYYLMRLKLFNWCYGQFTGVNCWDNWIPSNILSISITIVSASCSCLHSIKAGKLSETDINEKRVNYSDIKIYMTNLSPAPSSSRLTARELSLSLGDVSTCMEMETNENKCDKAIFSKQRNGHAI